MNLKYRGTTYQTSINSVHPNYRGNIGKYRGIHYHFDSQLPPQNPPSLSLKFRGVNY